MDGYSKEDFEQYREVVYSNTIQSLATIIRAMETLNVPFASTDRERDAAMGKFLPPSLFISFPFVSLGQDLSDGRHRTVRKRIARRDEEVVERQRSSTVFQSVERISIERFGQIFPR